MATIGLEREWAAEALFRLADWTSGTGDAYFRGLVQGLADVLSVRWVYLSRLHPQLPRHVQVVAGWADGPAAENIEYRPREHAMCRGLDGGDLFLPDGRG